jgi:hypothetical protein
MSAHPLFQPNERYTTQSWGIFSVYMYNATMQAREQNFLFSQFQPILAYKMKMKFGANRHGYKFYPAFKLWDVAVITFIFMASYHNTAL